MNTFITVILTIIIVIYYFSCFFHIAIVIIVTNIIFIVITILLLPLLLLSLQPQLPSISSTKYFLLISLLGDYNENKAFLPVLCYPCHFFFITSRNWCYSFSTSNAVFTIYSFTYLFIISCISFKCL